MIRKTFAQITIKYFWRQCRPGNLCTHGQVQATIDPMNQLYLAKVYSWVQIKFFWIFFYRERVTRIMTVSLQASISAWKTALKGLFKCTICGSTLLKGWRLLSFPLYLINSFPEIYLWWVYFLKFISERYISWNLSLIKTLPEWNLSLIDIFSRIDLFQSLVPNARLPKQHWKLGDKTLPSWSNIIN